MLLNQLLFLESRVSNAKVWQIISTKIVIVGNEDNFKKSAFLPCRLCSLKKGVARSNAYYLIIIYVLCAKKWNLTLILLYTKSIASVAGKIFSSLFSLFAWLCGALSQRQDINTRERHICIYIIVECGENNLPSSTTRMPDTTENAKNAQNHGKMRNDCWKLLVGSWHKACCACFRSFRETQHPLSHTPREKRH